MEVDEILDQLREHSNQRGIAYWEKNGVRGLETFGWGLTQLKKFAKKYTRNNDLADALFELPYYDTKTLAFLIWDGKTLERDKIQQLALNSTYWGFSHVFASVTLAKSPLQEELFRDWRRDENPVLRRLAFAVLYNLAKGRNTLGDDFFIDALEQIETDLQKEENFVRDAMNNAVLAMGSRSKSLYPKALSVAQSVGRVEVDYGDNSCQALDVVKHLNSERIVRKHGIK